MKKDTASSTPVAQYQDLDLDKPIFVRDPNFSFRILTADSKRVSMCGVSMPLTVEVWATRDPSRVNVHHYTMDGRRDLDIRVGQMYNLDLYNKEAPTYRPWRNAAELKQARVRTLLFRGKTWKDWEYSIVTGCRLYYTDEIRIALSHNHARYYGLEELFSDYLCSSDEGEAWLPCGLQVSQNDL